MILNVFAEWMAEWCEYNIKAVPKHLTTHLSARKTAGGKPSTCYLSYVAFKIENFKSIKLLDLPMSEDNLVLLLGLNESGKTTILKAIEHFDFRNDPDSKASRTDMMSNIKNLADPVSNKEVRVTATIKVDSKLDYHDMWKLLRDASKESPDVVGQVQQHHVERFVQKLNQKGQIKIARIVPFKAGKSRKGYYAVDMKELGADSVMKSGAVSHLCAMYILSLCPYIIYFEDFKDMVPDKIFVDENSDAFNQNWFDIIEGLFYDTDPKISVRDFIRLSRPGTDQVRESKTIINRVNDNFNKKFTAQWKRLSGVKNIREVSLVYDEKKKCFCIEVKDKDGTTFYVADRSRGATWYIGFLMKTEFCRRKMRADVGRLVYLIDEPASNLHSTAQTRMLEDFTKLLQDASVVYATHSQYLVSLENIRTTYVVKKTGGKIACKRLGDFINKGGNSSFYYQPVADCLQITPHTLDTPWKKALVVEGPSDMLILNVMYRIVMESDPNFVIYPASGASTMSPLISLNLGWGANFKILLDADEAGLLAKADYQKQFGLEESFFVSFPERVKEIEKMFNPEEVQCLWKMVYDEDVKNPSKKQVSKIFIRLALDGKTSQAASKIIGDETREKFRELFTGQLVDFAK